MPEQMQEIAPEPELTKWAAEPKGVLQKNLKPVLYLGAAVLVIVAAVFSGTGKKPATQGTTPSQPPQPMLQDTTDNNVQDLKNQVAAAQQKAAQQATSDQALAAATLAQQAAAQAYGPTGQAVPCVPGQPCPQQQAGYAQEQQLSPAAQEEQQLAAKDRELAYNSRFASNLVYSRAPDAAAPPPSGLSESGSPSPGQASSLLAPRPAGDPPAASAAQAASERRPEVNIDSATGQPYLLYEGTTLDTVLMNRLR